MAPNTAARNPLTWNPCTQCATAQNRKPLMMKMKSPSVNSVTGSVSSTSSGRISVLMSPSTECCDDRRHRVVDRHPRKHVRQHEQRDGVDDPGKNQVHGSLPLQGRSGGHGA